MRRRLDGCGSEGGRKTELTNPFSAPFDMALPHLLQKVEPLDEKVVKARSAPEFIQVHRQVRRMKVVCVSIPEAGHLVPTVQVAKALAQRGHEAILVTMDCAAGKFAKGCEAVGCRFVGLVKGMPGSDAGHGPIAEFHRRGQMMQAFFQYCELMQEELRDFLRSDGADVIVADFASFSAQRVAEELQIPCIFNVPGPLELCRNLSMWLAMPFCFAVAIMTRSLTETRLTYSMFSELVPALKRHVCLVNSFYGLDLPSTVPAHVVLTGPTAPRSGNDLSRRETSDEKMNRWLADHVRPEGLQIVYVTMGSMQILEQFQLEALFYGLKSLTPKVAVAWSMKEEQHRQLPGGHEALPSHWFVQKWLPQGEALHLPEVAVVVTHCGFGGLNETLAAGKPLVALPFRADQPGNAQLAQKRGFAEVLKPRTLTAHGVQAALQKVLTDGKYAQRAREVQGSLLKTKGAQACVEAIEDFMERDGCQELFLRDTVASRRPLALLAALGATMALGALGYVQLRRS